MHGHGIASSTSGAESKKYSTSRKWYTLLASHLTGAGGSSPPGNCNRRRASTLPEP